MAEARRKFDEDFKQGAVRLVGETGKPIAQVARELGINEGTLGNWVNQDKRTRGEAAGGLSEDERAELARCVLLFIVLIEQRGDQAEQDEYFIQVRNRDMADVRTNQI